MATEKLREGIANFAQDLEKVEEIVKKRLVDYVAPVEGKVSNNGKDHDDKMVGNWRKSMIKNTLTMNS